MIKATDSGKSDSRLSETGRFRRSAVLVGLSEIGLVASAVAVFFAFLTILINFYFPRGSSLVQERDMVTSSGQQNRVNVELEIMTGTSAIRQLFAGELVTIQRRVQRRSASSLAWNDANVGDTFAENDAVQTFTRSTALLTVNDLSRITIGQNSLIVFDRREADPFTADYGSVLVMIDGELAGQLSSDDEANFRFGVSLPNSDITFVREDPDDDVDFLITVNEDRSTTINVHGGSAQIVARTGERMTISGNQSITINSSGTEMFVRQLPAAPLSIGPTNLKTVTYRNVPATIDFNWGVVADADRYHIVIARDADFSDRIVDDDVLGTSFRHGALGPGTYYWYVRSRASWAQSKMSAVRSLQVIQDTVPPVLELEPPPTIVSVGPWSLRGRTDPGVEIYVDGSPVTHSNGHFDHSIQLSPGANIIVVKAIDAVGNLNYASISINAM